MESIIPAAFGDWTSQGDADLIKPLAEGSLAARLYSQSVSRIYSHANGRDDVMVKSYDVQVSVLEPQGQKAAFWQAPIVVVP